MLAAIGIYGVMSFAVAQRTHEIGLRMALGAHRRQVLGQILREGMTTALIGTALGSAGAVVIGRALARHRLRCRRDQSADLRRGRRRCCSAPP